ncbi:MAG: ABC transporter permease [Acidimicrobiales bacterium]
MPVVVVAVAAVFQALNSQFLSGGNLEALFQQAALPGVAALGLTMVLAVNQYDISIQAVAGLGTVVAAALIVNQGIPVLAALGAGLAVGCLIGVFNGVLVAYMGLAAFIVTIGVESLAQGAQFTTVGQVASTISLPPSGGLVAFARSTVGPVPSIAIVALVIAVLLWLLLDHTTIGRYMRAVGNNPVAAKYAGINVKRMILLGFVFSGGLCGLAGGLYAGSEAIVEPLSGLSILLPAFAACFIGAAMFRVGEFNIPGTVVGVVLAQEVANGLVLANVGSYVTYFFQGGILIAAIAFGRLVGTYRGA